MNDKDVKVIKKEGFDVLGYELRTTTKNDKNLVDVPEFWYKLIKNEKFEEIPNKVNPEIFFGICADCGPDGDFSYIVGQEVDLISEVPEGMRSVALKDSRYAVFETDDKTPEIVNKTFDHIFEKWLPESKYTRDFGEDFEQYFRTNGRMQKGVIIHIPVKLEGRTQ